MKFFFFKFNSKLMTSESSFRRFHFKDSLLWLKDEFGFFSHNSADVTAILFSLQRASLGFYISRR
jgi:hypothetical protein